VRRADNLTTFMCRLSKTLGASTSWSPKGLPRPVMGLLFIIHCIEASATINRHWKTRVGIATRLWAGLSGVHILAGCSLLQNVQTVSGPKCPSIKWARGLRRRGLMLTTHFYLVPRLRMSGTTSTLRLHAFMAWGGCTLRF
jgi:hypothetical protein